MHRKACTLLPGCAMAEKAQPSPSAKAGAGQSMATTSFLPVTHKVISTAPGQPKSYETHRSLNSLESFSTLSFAQLHLCTVASDTTCSLLQTETPQAEDPEVNREKYKDRSQPGCLLDTQKSSRGNSSEVYQISNRNTSEHVKPLTASLHS